jgi:hypothetical protein
MTVSQLVGRERRHLGALLVARAAAWSLAAGALLLGLFSVALRDARWITRPAAPLTAWSLVLVVLALTLWWTRRALRRETSSHAVAAAIERERALRDGSLRAALEVGGDGAFGRRASDQMAKRLGTLGASLAPATRRRSLRVGAVAAGLAILAMAQLGAARTMAPDGWRAVRHPVKAWTGELLPPLVIEGVPAMVLRGEKLKLRVLAPERKRLTLHQRATGAPWDAQELPVEGGAATTVLGPVDADLILVADDGRLTSDTVVVRVTDRPFVGDVAIRATYPSYLERPAETIALGEPARVPRGTRLSIRGRASTELASIALVKGADTLRFAPSGHGFSGQLNAAESGRWTWTAAGRQGPIADVPLPLELEVLADSVPRVEVVSPARDTVVLADARTTLQLIATDDHAVSTVAMRSWRRMASGSAMPEVAQSLASPDAAQWSESVELDLAPRGLEPGDELHVIIAATDNSPWRQTAESRELVLRVPTLTEQRDSARALADSTASRVAAAARAQRELAQRTSEAARSRSDRPAQGQSAQARDRQSERAERGERTSSFESAEQARALAERQKALQDEIRKAQRDAEALERQLKAAGALDSSLQRQLRDAQQLLQDALTPELQRQLDDVMQSAQKLSPDEMRKALQNLSEAQQRLREQLERSAEMLKRAALEGAMQTMKDEARELANREKEVADSMSRGEARTDSSAAASARDLSRRSERLSEELEELSERLKRERAEAGTGKVQSAAEKAQQSAEAMKRAGGERGEQRGEQRAGQQQPSEQRAQSGERQQASAAREGAQQMESAAQALEEAREQQIQEWKNELTGELDRAIQETLQLAREQEALSERARNGEEQQSMRGDQSALQQGVERVGERLQKSAGRSAHISSQSQGAVGDARRRVQEASQQLAESQRGGSDAAGAMQEAAQALNRAAAALVKDRDRAANAASASGFSEMIAQMREMAKQQGSLNAQAMGLMPAPGQQPGPATSAQMRALGRRQRDLADKLGELGDEAGGGRAQELAREMRQLADALEGARMDQSIAERQQRLFRRLLDAGLTLEKDERDDRGERESRSASDAQTITPGTDASGRPLVRFREPTWNELRGLTAEERRAVLEYFKRINADQPR